MGDLGRSFGIGGVAGLAGAAAFLSSGNPFIGGAAAGLAGTGTASLFSGELPSAGQLLLGAGLGSVSAGILSRPGVQRALQAGLSKVPGLGRFFSAGSRARSLTIALEEEAVAASPSSPSSALIPRNFATIAPNGGRLGGFSTTETLRPGTLIDRFGPRRGRFVSPAGTPFSQRGLPPETALESFETFEVLRALDVEGSIAAPAFGGGLGVQFRLPASVQELIDAGFLRAK